MPAASRRGEAFSWLGIDRARQPEIGKTARGNPPAGPSEANMDERENLLAAVAADPDNDLPLLI